MLPVLLLALLAQSSPHDHHTRESRRLGGRIGGQRFAFFEAFPQSGAGTTTACSTTAPTGAKGETLTFTRASNATCSKKGLATTGIADGDLVVMSNNVARVEPDSDGVLGLRVEGSRINVLLQSGDISNAAYADVGTPTLTGSQTDPFATSTAVQVEDNDAAAYEGRSQSVTVSAATAYILSCFIKAGTLTTARLSLDGTACNVSGLSTSTWTRATCADASSSGVSIAVQLLAGNATSDTGTVTWGGCQVEAGTYATSYVPTGAAAVTRQAETAYFTPSGLLTSPLSIAGSIYAPATSAASPNTAIVSVPATSVTEGTNLSLLYGNSSGLRCWNNGNYYQRAVYYGGGQERAWCAIDRASATAADRVRAEWPTGTALTVAVNGNTGAGSTAVAIRIGDFGAAGSSSANGIISRVCVDPDPARCR